MSPAAVMPDLEWRRAPCPTCGARTLRQAETRCRPTSDESGERSCPGDRDDDKGWIIQPTAKSIARLDAWIDSQLGASDDQPA